MLLLTLRCQGASIDAVRDIAQTGIHVQHLRWRGLQWTLVHEHASEESFKPWNICNT